MGSLEKKYNETLKLAQKSFKDDPILNDYIQASHDFNKLVEKGLAVKRGHNLRSPGQMHLNKESFNIRN